MIAMMKGADIIRYWPCNQQIACMRFQTSEGMVKGLGEVQSSDHGYHDHRIVMALKVAGFVTVRCVSIWLKRWKLATPDSLCRWCFWGRG